MQKIVPCLWFNLGDAEKAVDFYLSIFPEAKILATTYYTESGPAEVGSVLTIEFELFNQRYVALNGGPEFPHTDAISFMVQCDTQEEIDYYWDKLMMNGGHPEQCGWLRDKFGVAWQIVPKNLAEMIGSEDRNRAASVMAVMLKMIKLDIAVLNEAYGNSV